MGLALAGGIKVFPKTRVTGELFHTCAAPYPTCLSGWSLRSIREHPGLSDGRADDMEDVDVDEASTRPDAWGSAVASGDAVQLSKMVLEWSASKPEVALSLLRKCIAVLEEDLAYCAGACPPSSSTLRLDGVVQHTRLDAFAVILNQSCDGRDWFSSTKELQLASLQFCAACRNVATVNLRVDDAVPRRLLAAADAPPPGRKRLCSTRVPRLRARRVLWDLPTAIEMRRPLHAVADAVYMQFSWRFADTLEGVEWPRLLHALEIDCKVGFTRCLTAGTVWPESLQEISFGDNFNQSLRGAVLPKSLRRLKFGDWFDRSVQEVVWPTPLQQLTFGEEFDRSIEGVVWPPFLRQLTFGDRFNQAIEGLVLPTSLLELTFGDGFNQPIEEVVWPTYLQQLTFGFYFDRPIEGVSLPTSLQRLTFGDSFDQPIEGVLLPTSLQRLTFGCDFDQPIEKTKWPASLEHLTFGDAFDHPFEEVRWPNSLRQLRFGEDFNRPVEKVTWPTALEDVSFGAPHSTAYPVNGIRIDATFNQAIGGARWPESLRRLTLGGTFSSSCEHLGAWMPNLEEFTFLLEEPSRYGRLLGGISWPKSLRKLTIFDDASLEGVTIPRNVQVFCPARET